MNDVTRRGLIFGAATVAAYGALVGVQRLCLSAFANDSEPEDETGSVKIARFAADGSPLGVVNLPRVRKSKMEWQKQLTQLQYDVTRRAATEWAFTGTLFDEHRSGLYRCIDCDTAVFSSATKFDSSTGWPSFWAPIAQENVYEKLDISIGVLRREVKCRLCEAHLGHVLHGWPGADRIALLHELRCPAVRTCGVSRVGWVRRIYKHLYCCFTSASKSS